MKKNKIFPIKGFDRDYDDNFYDGAMFVLKKVKAFYPLREIKRKRSLISLFYPNREFYNGRFEALNHVENRLEEVSEFLHNLIGEQIKNEQDKTK